jgi:pleckstrin homology domain-containing family F member 2
MINEYLNYSFFFCHFIVMNNGWLIKTPNKSFAVYAATHTEKEEWMDHIQKCVKDLLKRSKFI